LEILTDPSSAGQIITGNDRGEHTQLVNIGFRRVDALAIWFPFPLLAIKSACRFASPHYRALVG
jgi:hypothetical protein